MKKFNLLVVLAVLSCAGPRVGNIPAGFDPESFETRKMVECTPRGGLPNFFGKLESGVPEVNIAYFGGSITCQNGYRVLSREYFASRYPGTRFNEVYAAIGGTGSDLGAYRCGHDVLSGRPDLVFVEFAVNDSGTEPAVIRRNMEGIVRQIWAADSSTDIIFVYTVTESCQKNMLDDRMERSSSVMEDIADYYSIPSVNFGAGLVPLIENGTLVMKSDSKPLSRVSGSELNVSAEGDGTIDGLPVNAEGRIAFSSDGVHPFENTGHVLYERALERSWPMIMACGKVRPHKIPSPMVEGCLDKVETVSFEDGRVNVDGEWKLNTSEDPVTSPFLGFSDKFYTFEPGSEISFRFRGSSAALYDLLGPQSSALTVTVDGEERSNTRFDGYCTYHRLALMGLCSSLDPEAVHSVTVKVSGSAPDKRGILFDHNKPDYDANPAKYAPLHYFAGCIFVAGEIVR